MWSYFCSQLTFAEGSSISQDEPGRKIHIHQMGTSHNPCEPHARARGTRVKYFQGVNGFSGINKFLDLPHSMTPAVEDLSHSDGSMSVH